MSCIYTCNYHSPDTEHVLTNFSVQWLFVCIKKKNLVLHYLLAVNSLQTPQGQNCPESACQKPWISLSKALNQLVNMLIIALNQLVNMLIIALNQLVNMLTIMIALNHESACQYADNHDSTESACQYADNHDSTESACQYADNHDSTESACQWPWIISESPLAAGLVCDRGLESWCQLNFWKLNLALRRACWKKTLFETVTVTGTDNLLLR